MSNYTATNALATDEQIDTLPRLEDAKRSETFYAVARIAGQKAHKVHAFTLLEDATAKVVSRTRFNSRMNRMEPVYVTAVYAAGTTMYLAPTCGTIRSAGNWMVYENKYTAAETITCAKCLKA